MEQGAVADRGLQNSEFNWSGAESPSHASRTYRQVRQRTEQIVSELTDEDQQLQSMPAASPTKWHRAHTSWFFETFILQEFCKDYQTFNPAYETLFNSYYESVGRPFPRHQRGMLSRPSTKEIGAYRRHVDLALDELLRKLPLEANVQSLEVNDQARVLNLLELGLHHEQQHQELLVTDLKHAFLQNPLWPSFGINQSLPNAAPPLIHEKSLKFEHFEGGTYDVGRKNGGFTFDNEGPEHQVLLTCFEIAQEPLLNRSVLEFIEAGGYENPLLWLSDGWDWCRSQQKRHPSYWRQLDTSSFEELTLTGGQAVRAERIASHLTYFEVDAIARFLGARLPSEFEWEIAASSERLRSVGAVWEWTASAYQPYPGFSPEPGAVGEYNGKFMHGQQVLRGSSIATAPEHSRITYRNFFPASTYFQFSGARLARTPRK